MEKFCGFSSTYKPYPRYAAITLPNWWISGDPTSISEMLGEYSWGSLGLTILLPDFQFWLSCPTRPRYTTCTGGIFLAWTVLSLVRSTSWIFVGSFPLVKWWHVMATFTAKNLNIERQPTKECARLLNVPPRGLAIEATFGAVSGMVRIPLVCSSACHPTFLLLFDGETLDFLQGQE